MAGSSNIKPNETKQSHEAVLTIITTSQGEGMSDQPQRAELLKPWPGMQSDIRVICDEMVFELRKNGTAPIFLKSFRWEGDNICFEMPDWWNEARRRFSELYQQPEDDVRFQKANTAFVERMFQHFEGTSTLMRDQLEEVLAEFYEQEEIQVGTS